MHAGYAAGALLCQQNAPAAITQVAASNTGVRVHTHLSSSSHVSWRRCRLPRQRACAHGHTVLWREDCHERAEQVLRLHHPAYEAMRSCPHKLGWEQSHPH